MIKTLKYEPLVDGPDEYQTKVQELGNPAENIIPSEYPTTFNPSTWSWPGFIFAEFWCMYKGMISKAWKYIAIRYIPIFAIYAFLYFIYPGNSYPAERVLGDNPLLRLIIVLLLNGIIAHIWCGISGNREYSGFVNQTHPATIKQHRMKGVLFFILYTVVMFVISVVLFIMALIGIVASVFGSIFSF